MKTRTKAGITGVALATAAAVMVGAPSASGDHQSESSAYGISLGGQAGQPSVEYKGGKPEKDGGHLPPEIEGLASGGVLTVTASDDHATATLTNLTLGSGMAQLPEELRSGLQDIKTACDQLPGDEVPLEDVLTELPGELQTVVKTEQSLRGLCNVIGDGTFARLAEVTALDAQCTGNRGTVEVDNARIFGSTTPVLDSEVPRNTSLLPKELAPLVEVVLNRQTRKGDSFTVDGLVLKLGGHEVAVVASATCGGPIAHEPSAEKAPRPAPAPALAPAPVPVEQAVPVTG